MVSDDVGIAVVSLFYCFLYDNVADYGAALSLEGPSTLLPSVAADALVDLEQWPDPRCALPPLPPSRLPLSDGFALLLPGAVAPNDVLLATCY